jgi:hypothetical protein
MKISLEGSAPQPEGLFFDTCDNPERVIFFIALACTGESDLQRLFCVTVTLNGGNIAAVLERPQ